MVHTFLDGRCGVVDYSIHPHDFRDWAAIDFELCWQRSCIRPYVTIIVLGVCQNRYLVSALIPKLNIIHARSSHFLLHLESIYHQLLYAFEVPSLKAI
jgi:hypothetical protein